MTQPEALREALAELVACKDLKDEAEGIAFAGPSGPLGDEWERVYEVKRKDYLRRQPLAWERARAALEAHGAPEPMHALEDAAEDEWHSNDLQPQILSKFDCFMEGARFAHRRFATPLGAAPEPVAEVVAGKLGGHDLAYFLDTIASLPIGTKLYAAPQVAIGAAPLLALLREWQEGPHDPQQEKDLQEVLAALGHQAQAVASSPEAAVERERCAAICNDEARIRREAGDKHPEGSEAQGRCYAATRAAMNCAIGIRSGERVGAEPPALTDDK